MQKWCLVLCAVVVASCSQVAGPSNSVSKEKKPLPPMYVGTVDAVYPDKNFALIRVICPLPAPGTTLISHAPEGTNVRVGNMLVSEERLGPLRIPADIRSGTVMPGDYVYAYRPLSEPAAVEQSTVPATAGGGDEKHDPAEDISAKKSDSQDASSEAPVRTDVPAWQAEEGSGAGVIPQDSVLAPDMIPDTEGATLLPSGAR